MVGDPLLVRVCLTDDFPAGPQGERFRRRLIDSIIELVSGDLSVDQLSLSLEATTGALWSLFRGHATQSLRSQISATLAYLVLAPVVGASAAVEAIGKEQGL
jgi:hypothetical protein